MKYSITNYTLTRRVANVYGHDNKSLDSVQATAQGIKMVKCESISNGTYRIFVADTEMLYKNCGHVYASDRKNLFEVSASVKLTDMNEDQLHWALAYCFYNNLTVLYRKGYLVVSIYETAESLNDGSNLSEHSQHFKTLFKDFNTTYVGTEYNEHGNAISNDIASYNDVVRYFQSKSRRKQLTPSCYIKG